MKINAWSPAQLGKAPLVLFLYVRVSLGRDIMDSPETQERNGDLASKLLGATIIEIIYDLDESGQFFGHRKVLWMVDQIRQGVANGIMVLDTSRWGRNLTESRQYVKELYDAGGVLVSTTQPIDPTTADGLMIMNHFMNMDEHQGNKIGEGWVRTHNQRREKGKPHHGREVFGYSRCPECRRNERNHRAYDYCKKCKGVLQPNEVVKDFYADVFRQYNDGTSMKSLVTAGRVAGITTVKGKPLSVSGLRQAMDSGFAAGFIRVNDPAATHYTAGPWEWKTWVRGQHKRVISLGTWMRYVQRRQRQRKPETRQTEPSYALSTLLRCGVRDPQGKRCMAAMHANPSKTKVDTFRCGSESQAKGCTGVTISISRAERLVLEWVEDRAQGEELAAVEIKRNAQVKKDVKELRKLEARERVLKKRLDTLVDAFLDGTFTKAQVKTKQAEIESDLGIVRSKLAIIQESVTSNSAPPPEAFEGFVKIWPRLTVAEKQKALKIIIDHIVISKTEGQKANNLRIVPKWAPLEERLAVRGGKNWDRIRASRSLAS